METEINIFNFLEINKSELIHSQFIASLMNKNELYLQMFLDRIKCDIFNLEKDIKIITEKKLSKGKLNEIFGIADIWIGNSSKEKKYKRIIIENKIYAGDLKYQLSRYRNYLDKDRGKKSKSIGRLYYLTLEGKTASPYSTGNKKDNNCLNFNSPSDGYGVISYQKEILPWLEDIKKINKIDSLDILINHYIKIIERLTKYQTWLKDDKSITELQKNDKIKKNERKNYKIILELYFWEKLEKKIVEEYSTLDKVILFDSRKHFSHNRVKQFYNGEKKDYGIVFNNIRIEKEDKVLKISEGKFKDSGYIWEAKENNEKDIIKIDLNTLNNKTDISKKVDEVLKRIKLFSSDLL